MKIGVFIDAKLSDGGGFQQSLSTAQLLAKQSCPEFDFHFFTNVKQNVPVLNRAHVTAEFLSISRFDVFFMKVRDVLMNSRFFAFFYRRWLAKIDKYCINQRLDLLFFLGPSPFARYCDVCNFVITIWDLCHRDSPEFAEVRAFGEFHRRERFLQKVLPMAYRIITDSETGKNNIIRRYGIDVERIKALPFLPSITVSKNANSSSLPNVRQKYSISGDYIYYPAQFWPHKNHAYILSGIKILKDKYNIKLSAVFSGGDKGNLHLILQKAESLGVIDQVKYVGFVPSEDIPELYKNALALVMPTYFGPTNIPPIEAFSLGCPVLYSNLSIMYEQVKDYSMLIDLCNPESMATQLIKVINKEPTVLTIVEKARFKASTLTEEMYWNGLKNIFEDYKHPLSAWK